MKKLLMIVAIFSTVALLFFGNDIINAAATWESYNDAAHQNVDNEFINEEHTVYMFGEGFETSTAYHIGYYDGDGYLVQSEGQSSNGTGELSGECYFLAYKETAVAGIWHAVVYKDPASPPSIYGAVAESGSPYLLIVQGAPEKGSEAWWGWIVVNPTDSAKTITEVRVKRTDLTNMGWSIGVEGYPTSGWTIGEADGLYCTIPGGDQTIPAHSAKYYRVRAKVGVKVDPNNMTWSATVTGESVSDVTSQVSTIDRGSWGGMFYNKPDDTTEQTEGGTHPDGLYAYLDEDNSSNPLEAGTEYTFYVNVHEWNGKAIDPGGTLTITIPKEFTGVALVDYTDFSNAGVSGGGASDWTITGTNDSAISNGVDHLSFRATTPTGYSTNQNWEFDTRFTGTGAKGETVRYIVEANVLVQVPEAIIEDSFTVQDSAIPEFPEVMAAIGVGGLCFGIYYWMRKRVHRVHGVYGVKP